VARCTRTRLSCGDFGKIVEVEVVLGSRWRGHGVFFNRVLVTNLKGRDFVDWRIVYTRIEWL
jgi:hypothetical protein